MNLVNGIAQEHVAIEDRAIHYGDAIFETCAVKNKQVLLWDYHWQRLELGMSVLCFPRLDITQFKLALSQALDIYNDSVLKIIITRGSGERGYGGATARMATHIIQVSRVNIQVEEKADPLHYNVGRSRIVLPEDPLLARIKHTNRLHQVLAALELRDSDDIQENLLFDKNGCLISAIAANAYLVKGEDITTPCIAKNGVEGTIRRYLLNNISQFPGVSIGVKEAVHEDQIYDADELFLTNSIKGVMVVRKYCDHKYNKLEQENCVALRINRLLRANNVTF